MTNFIGGIFPALIDMEEMLPKEYRETLREMALQAFFQSEQVRLYCKLKKTNQCLTSLVIVFFPPFRSITLVLTFDDGERVEKPIYFEDLTWFAGIEEFAGDMILNHELKND